MAVGICQGWKRNTRMIIFKFVNTEVNKNNLKPNIYDYLAFLSRQDVISLMSIHYPRQWFACISSQRCLPWSQAEQQQAHGSEKYVHKLKTFFPCLLLSWKALHHLVLHGIPPGFCPKFWWLGKAKVKTLSIRYFVVYLHVSFLSGLSGYVSTC